MYSKTTNNNVRLLLKRVYIEVDKRGENAVLAGKLKILTSDVKRERYKTSLSLVFDLSDNLKNSLNVKLLAPTIKFFESVGPDQIIYNKSLLHMTLFTFLSAESENSFDPKSDNIDKYESLSLRALHTLHPVRIKFSKVLLSENCIFLAGFPSGNGIVRIRDEIKKMLEMENLRYYKGPKNRIAHISFVRWGEQIPIEVRGNVLKFIKSLNKGSESTAAFDKVDLVLGNSYSDGPTRKIVRSIYLK